MKKIFLLLIISLNLTTFTFAKAEVIDVTDEEKQFGDWKTFCKVDVMMGKMDCKIASKFYENNSVITVEPKNDHSAKINLVIPQIRTGEQVKLRIDSNNLIHSKIVTDKDFNSIPLSEEQKDLLYSQMLNGEFLFLRFNLKNVEKEITVKLSMRDLRNALAHSAPKKTSHTDNN